MPKTIAAVELERRLQSVLDDVVHQHAQYLVQRDSQPEAVLIPYDEFMRLQIAREERILDRFDRLMARMASASERYDDEEVACDVEAARNERAR